MTRLLQGLQEIPEVLDLLEVPSVLSLPRIQLIRSYLLVQKGQGYPEVLRVLRGLGSLRSLLVLRHPSLQQDPELL
jgi:hypothetical protein